VAADEVGWPSAGCRRRCRGHREDGGHDLERQELLLEGGERERDAADHHREAVRGTHLVLVEHGGADLTAVGRQAGDPLTERQLHRTAIVPGRDAARIVGPPPIFRATPRCA
jgi:hypothetical protein